MLYRSTDCLCRCGAPVENLAHSASFHSDEKIAPSKPGIKHLSISAINSAPWYFFKSIATTASGVKIFEPLAAGRRGPVVAAPPRNGGLCFCPSHSTDSGVQSSCKELRWRRRACHPRMSSELCPARYCRAAMRLLNTGRRLANGIKASGKPSIGVGAPHERPRSSRSAGAGAQSQALELFAGHAGERLQYSEHIIGAGASFFETACGKRLSSCRLSEGLPRKLRQHTGLAV